ncbi:hypothetical protein CFC21_075789 [Triticum aestivum]|uniref:DUF4220 domain-containing protein n=2 Tax=Triticum aestivum TaxID=4565 RepID=A0A3B6MKG2_WHEAT|nr:hypothetical protein CFC21_075789 [Triticum aestivum]
MKSLIELFNEWEIQQLVLLSFALQLYLFFTGSLRRHSSNRFLRYSIWIAYLGADLVAVYALGLLSRHDRDITFECHIPRRTHTVASFWAPFLLIHLGGQDTITAFAMEDNNLWLRHLLNLVVQVVLALYVYWKSIPRLHSVKLVVSGILVFVAGIIKYGERTWSLKCGNLKSLVSSTGHRFNKRVPVDTDGYPGIVSAALGMMPQVLKIFAARVVYSRPRDQLLPEEPIKMVREMRIELGLMYDDLYTKAVMLRTRSGIIVRCISQISIVAAFALFHAQEDKLSTYSEADIAITYSLLIGGLFLELCSMFVFMMPPWTWAWLKVRNWHRLAGLSWFIFYSDIGWPEKKQGWPNSMGQYNLASWLAPGSSDLQQQARATFSQRAMRRLFLDLLGAKKKNIFWMSKLLDTKYVDVDNMVIECVTKEIAVLASEVMKERRHRHWPNLEPLFINSKDIFIQDFGSAIVNIHVLTELLLSEQQTWSYMDAKLVEVCRKLSNYMMYSLRSELLVQ